MVLLITKTLKWTTWRHFKLTLSVLNILTFFKNVTEISASAFLWKSCIKMSVAARFVGCTKISWTDRQAHCGLRWSKVYRPYPSKREDPDVALWICQWKGIPCPELVTWCWSCLNWTHYPPLNKLPNPILSYLASFLVIVLAMKYFLFPVLTLTFFNIFVLSFPFPFMPTKVVVNYLTCDVLSLRKYKWEKKKQQTVLHCVLRSLDRTVIQ